jgi:hypothetical protein
LTVPCYLPAYAPNHNPTEYLNNDLKQQLRQQPQPNSKEELIKSTRSVLHAIQRLRRVMCQVCSREISKRRRVKWQASPAFPGQAVS